MTSLTTIFPNGFAAATASTDLADPVQSFRQHCEAAGLTIKDLIPDGEIHRVAHVSSKKGCIGWLVHPALEWQDPCGCMWQLEGANI
jgi:hypothetical protein